MAALKMWCWLRLHVLMMLLLSSCSHGQNNVAAPAMHMTAKNLQTVVTKGFMRKPVTYYAKSTCTYQLCRVIELNNDVQENPGPVRNPCGTCDRPVAKNHRHLSCDTCKRKCHITCGRISLAKFRWISSQNSPLDLPSLFTA